MLYKKITNTHAETKLYGNIGGWFANGDTFTSFLDGLETSGFKELTIRWHCYGGSVFEGNVIGNAFGRSALKINIIIDGLAASMGCFVLPYVPVENIQIAENAFGMVHRPSAGEMGDADAHLNTAKLLQDMESNFIKVVSERSGKTKDEVKSLWFDGKDHWLNADEMVLYGFVSKKVSAVAKNLKELDKQTIENMQVESIYDQYAASLDKNLVINKNKKIMNVALLIAAFALTGVTAESPETEILAALKKKFETLETKVSDMEAEAKAKVTAALKTVLDTAEASGKFDNVPGQTKEQVRAVYSGIGEKAGVESLSVVLAGFGGKIQKPTIMSTIGGGRSSASASASAVQNWDWYQQNDPQALEAMANENHENHDTFRELYKAEFKTYPQ